MEKQLRIWLSLSGPCPGILTRAIPGQSVYLQEIASQKQAQIGRYDPFLPGPDKKMRPLAAGFETLGIPALQRCLHAASPWIAIDEIGYLETNFPAYQKALDSLLENKRLLAVVRKQELPFLQKLCRREDVFCLDMDDPFGSCSCVIMASGLSTRFGKNKLLAPFRGRPLICSILDATEGIFSKRAVITRYPEIARLCQEREIPAVLHDMPFRSDTVRLGLEAVGDAGSCMFCPADQPLLRQETIAALCLAAAQEPCAIWRPLCENTAGSPVLFPSWTFPELKALSQKQGGSLIIKKYPECLRYLSIQDIEELKDIDQPADLQALLQQ